jgi:hypothetical protein
VALVLLALVAGMLLSGDDVDDGATTTPAGEVGTLSAPSDVGLGHTIGASRVA